MPCNNARLAFRRIARATDTRTVIAALVPPGVVLNDVAPYFVRRYGDETDEAYLLGVMSALPFDWMARRIVESHVDFHVIYPLAIPLLDRGSPLRSWIAQTAALLAAGDSRFDAWLDRVHPGADPSTIDRVTESARLDALVAAAYGLSEDDLQLVFETFHIGWDFSARLDRTLTCFRDL